MGCASPVMPAKNMKCASVSVLLGLPKRSPTLKSSNQRWVASLTAGSRAPQRPEELADLARRRRREESRAQRGRAGQTGRVPREMLLQLDQRQSLGQVCLDEC